MKQLCQNCRGRPVRRKHRCSRCDQFRRKTGKERPQVVANLSNYGFPLKKRFWMKVDKSLGLGPWGNCWEWRGGLNNKCYGLIGVDSGKLKLATHVRWFLKYGYWPKQLNHTCDNSLCIRLSHLYEGTQKQNTEDKVKRGRAGKKLTEEKVIKMRILRESKGWTQEKLGKYFNVGQQSVSRALNKKTWGHVQ